MKIQFSIRDLLWLTALVAVLMAWWADRSHLQSRCVELENALTHTGGGAF